MLSIKIIFLVRFAFLWSNKFALYLENLHFEQT